MANGSAFSAAIAVADAAPKLGVGCHVDLIQLAPVLPVERVRSLVEAGHFRPGLARFAAAAMRGKLNGAEITAEASAQIQKLQAAGVKVTHFDTHKHTH